MRSSRCSIRQKFGALDRLTTPVTSYPFERSSSARYDPSCPVIPVIIARLLIEWSAPPCSPEPFYAAALARSSNQRARALRQCGIAKPGVPLLSAVTGGDLPAIVEARAAERGAVVKHLDREVSIADVSVSLSLGMTFVFMSACLVVIWWVFKTGHRIKA